MEIVTTRTADDPRLPDGVMRVEYLSAVDGLRDWALVWPGPVRELWVVVVHGHGACGDQIFTRPDIRDLWLPQFRDVGAGILSVNLRGNAWMSPRAACDLHELVGWLRSEHHMEQALFCSGSMGGTSNLIYAVLHPKDVQGVVARGAATDIARYCRWCREQQKPILHEIADAIVTAYGGPPDAVPQTYARHSSVQHAARLTMPVFLAHGQADAVIPLSQARALAELLAGSPRFRYVEIPGGNHDAPLTETTGFEWVFNAMIAG